MSSILTGAVRQLTKPAVVSRTARSFHTTPAPRGGAGAPDYVHAEKMYNIDAMSNPKATFGMMTLASLTFGFGVPIFAINFQLRK